MSLRSWGLLPFVCMLVFVAYGFASASDSVSCDQAKQTLQVFVDEMIDLVKQNQGEISDSVTGALHNRAIKEFDFSTFSMLSLGKKYQEFSTDEKARFEQYFSRLIAKTYVSRLEGQNLNQVSVEYLEPAVLKARKDLVRVDVPTNLIHDNISTPVTYRMMKKGSQDWKIYDVVIEGVTMTANYREQFRNYISESPAMIISDVQKKLEE